MNGADGDAQALAAGVARAFRRRLLDEMLPRIGDCVRRLGEDGVWRRPGPTSNSVGNLLLHLRGNTTQWILGALGGDVDARDRAAEFSADGGTSSASLLAELAACWRRACDVVDRLTVADLLRERTIQGRYRETGLSAVLHVLEHCSGHAGQIYAWTKQTTGADLRFYDL